VKALVILAPSKGIPARETLSKLKLFSGLKDARRWSGALRTVPRTLQREDGDFLLNELKRREGTPLEPKAEPGSYHDQIRQLLFELGEMEGRHPEKEKPIDGERIDVAWKRIERGDPTIVFEVQISGNFYEALAKLKHAWDKWNSRPFLVTTEAFRGKALDWVRGSFHEMQEELRIVDCEKVKELHEAIRKSKNLKEELGIG
jgi:hypothetical protein